jgi:hypothetical protein
MLAALTVDCTERKPVAISTWPLVIANLSFLQHDLVALGELCPMGPVCRYGGEDTAYAETGYASENHPEHARSS